MPKTKTKKTIKADPRYRGFTVERAGVDEEKRTVELTFSSEEPVSRWDGDEILDHSPGAVRLGRLQTGGPVLVDHDRRDHVGVVESVEIGKDRRGRALVRFGRGARADEIFKDVVDGIRSNVSVGYRVHKALIETTGKHGDVESYRVTDWEPIEITLTSVPADPTVGVDRSDAETNEFIFETTEEVREMPKDKENENGAAPVDVVRIESDASTKARADMQVNIAAVLKAGDESERFGGVEVAREVLAAGGSVDDFNRKLLERMGKADPIAAADPDIGLTEREADNFSFVRAINALVNPNDKRAQEAAKFERECSDAAAAVMQREAQGIIVPLDVLKRDLVAGTAAAGGDTVSTDLLTGSFIEMLRNRAFMLQLATLLTGLNGNIAIPRQTGGATAYWVAESGSPTESQQAFDQVTLSPETLGAFTDFSRKLMLQSSIDVEGFVRNDLARTLALEIDRVAINGSGTGSEPTGIMNQTGIGAVSGGTNGLALNFANAVNLESEVAVDNADIGSLRYLTNPRVRGQAKQTIKFANTGNTIWEPGNTINGYETVITNQVPSNLPKGTGSDLSAMIFGNFADLIIGMWGGLDLTIDPFAMSTSGGVRVVALQDIDLAVRHPESFAAMTDIIIPGFSS